mmetsp:Transcript_13824/g.37102  ORF Transcript_13824/g.37102 Transcript_13824/m.37102 type:complete len:234 (+) Transcript_13824:155-856(+)
MSESVHLMIEDGCSDCGRGNRGCAVLWAGDDAGRSDHDNRFDRCRGVRQLSIIGVDGHDLRREHERGHAQHENWSGEREERAKRRREKDCGRDGERHARNHYGHKQHRRCQQQNDCSAHAEYHERNRSNHEKVHRERCGGKRAKQQRRVRSHDIERSSQAHFAPQRNNRRSQNAVHKVDHKCDHVTHKHDQRQHHRIPLLNILALKHHTGYRRLCRHHSSLFHLHVCDIAVAV